MLINLQKLFAFQKNILKYQWLIVSLWIYLLIYIVASYKPKELITYNLIASYVDYEFGFIKRGLLSEICQRLYISHITSLKMMTYLGCFGFIATLTYQFKDKLSDANGFITYLLLMFSPLFIKNYLYDVGRTDILFFILLLSISFSRYKIVNICLLLYPLMVLLHEAIALMFLPATIFVYWTRFNKQKYTKMMIAMSVFLFFIFSLIVFKYGYPDVPIQNMQEYILNKKQIFNVKLIPTDQLLNFYLNNWYMSLSEHFIYSGSLKYLKPILKNIHSILLLCILNYTLFIVILKTLRENYTIFYVISFLSSGFIVLMLFAFDRTRFVADMFGILIICCIATHKELFFNTLSQKIIAYPVPLRFLLIASIIAIPYAGVGVPDLF